MNANWILLLMLAAAPAIAASGDTIIVDDSSWIEIDRSAQRLYHHFRSGITDTHSVSTGDNTIPEGIATPTGVFRIRARERKHFSRRFGVMMYWWMPFNGGVGLHALGGNAYYGYLGQVPSSHGCVRLSRESAERIFMRVSVGTLVYVHAGSRRRTVLFAPQPHV
jgi:lipoprotein-anchoring transpeptidase ErfK/SrfK